MKMRIDPHVNGYTIKVYSDDSRDRRIYDVALVEGEKPLTHRAEFRRHVAMCAQRAEINYARSHGIGRYTTIGEDS